MFSQEDLKNRSEMQDSPLGGERRRGSNCFAPKIGSERESGNGKRTKVHFCGIQYPSLFKRPKLMYICDKTIIIGELQTDSNTIGRTTNWVSIQNTGNMARWTVAKLEYMIERNALQRGTRQPDQGRAHNSLVVIFYSDWMGCRYTMKTAPL